MVYPHEHVLLRFHGHFGTSTSDIKDRWSSGLRIGLPGSAPAYDIPKLQTLVNAAQAAAFTFHASIGAAAGTSCYLDFATGAQIGVSGKYSPPGQLTVIGTPNPSAGSGTPTLPWNTASVISLRTNIPRGRGSNGRVYWPATALSVASSTGRVASSAVTSRVTAAKTFLDAVNVAANTYSAGAKVVVASNVGGGLIAYVTAIRSDDRLDSIERRENQQPVTWQNATLA